MSDTERMTRAVLTSDGRVLIEQPDGSYRPAEDRTDWQKVDRMSEEELEAIIASDPDDPAHDRDFWKQARLVYPKPKERVTMRVDGEVLDWFRAQGRGYQTRMNAVLRAYVDAHRQR